MACHPLVDEVEDLCARTGFILQQVLSVARRLPADSVVLSLELRGVAVRQAVEGFANRVGELSGWSCPVTVSVPDVVTERLILRRPTQDHLQDWANRVFADPDVIRYLPRRDLTPLQRAQRALEIFDRSWSQHPVGGWVILERASGQLIGHCEIGYRDDTDEWELGYALARSVWGQGMATEAAEAATRFGFEHSGLERMIAVVIPENKASLKVLEKLGFVHERDDVYYDTDIFYYAITRDRFQPSGAPYEVVAGP